MWLFFGCRSESQDWIFRREMESFLAKGTLSKLSTAFSRDAAEKVYVQVRGWCRRSVLCVRGWRRRWSCLVLLFLSVRVVDWWVCRCRLSVAQGDDAVR